MKELCHYHVIDRPRSVLEQFKDGLKTLGILGLIRKHPAQFEVLFCSQGRCNTPESVDMLFHVEYSINGTMEKERQEFIRCAASVSTVYCCSCFQWKRQKIIGCKIAILGWASFIY